MTELADQSRLKKGSKTCRSVLKRMVASTNAFYFHPFFC